MNLTRTKLTVGLTAPVRILHTTDVHLTFADEHDTPEHHELMVQRTETFRNKDGVSDRTPLVCFRDALALARRENLLHVCTGDAIDIHTHGNLALFRELIEGEDLMFSPGGHEHQRVCVRTMEEPYPYWETIRPKLEREFSRFDLYFESRVINGLNIITADNSLDYFPRRTVEAFKKELERGLPIIVFFHDPIWDRMLNLTEPSHPNVRLTPEDYRVSHEMIDLLLNHPLVITTFGGHGHRDAEHALCGKVHYMTDGLFRDSARLIEVV